MNAEWYKNPTVLMIGGVGIFAAIILMRNQGQSGGSQNVGDLTTPVGQSYSFLDGSGIQHIIATDPNGNLVNYAAIPPSISTPYAGELSSVVGSMSNYGSGSNYLGGPYTYLGGPYTGGDSGLGMGGTLNTGQGGVGGYSTGGGVPILNPLSGSFRDSGLGMGGTLYTGTNDINAWISGEQNLNQQFYTP